jgi:hypothetical protein
MVAFGAGTDGAKLLVGNIPAFPAINYVISHSDNSRSKGLNFLNVAFQQMQSHAQGGFSTDPRQSGKFVDRLFQEFGRIGLQVK